MPPPVAVSSRLLRVTEHYSDKVGRCLLVETWKAPTNRRSLAEDVVHDTTPNVPCDGT